MLSLLVGLIAHTVGSFGCFVAVIVVFIVGFVSVWWLLSNVVVLSEENIQDLPKIK